MSFSDTLEYHPEVIVLWIILGIAVLLISIFFTRFVFKINRQEKYSKLLITLLILQAKKTGTTNDELEKVVLSFFEKEQGISTNLVADLKETSVLEFQTTTSQIPMLS